MHSFVSFNHQILPASEINLSAVSSAALYGKGVFTTAAVFRSRPFLWDKHWKRLTDNALKAGIELSGFTAGAVEQSVFELIKANRIERARLRVTFFDGSSSSNWAHETKNKTALMIQTAEMRPVPGNLRLTVSPYPVNSNSPLAGVKSCNYLENLLAFEHAGSFGFDEAIRLNEHGMITSACLANVFWIKNGAVFTPDLPTGCLAGTMREFVLEIAEEIGLPLFCIEENPAGLLDADEVFITSSGIGIASVSSIDERQFSYDISKTLLLAFEDRKL